LLFGVFCFFFFKQKTAYEMRISDWSSDVCSSDLRCTHPCCSVRAMAGVAGGGSVARGKDAGKRDAEIERAVGLHVVVRRAAAAVLHGAAGERDLRVGLR